MGLRPSVLYLLLTALLQQGEQCLMGLRPLVLYCCLLFFAFGSASTTRIDQRNRCALLLLVALLQQGEQCLMGLRPLVFYCFCSLPYTGRALLFCWIIAILQLCLGLDPPICFCC